MNPNLLFVYGTLLPEFQHPMGKLLQNNAQSLGKGRSEGKLYNLGEYPGLREDNEIIVRGELFKIHNPSIWKDLDWYEGCHGQPNDEYYKVVKTVVLDTGKQHEAWIYFFRPELREELLIEHGDYLKFLAEQI